MKRIKIANLKLLKTLTTLALPIMATNLLHMLYNLADTYFLGKLGPEAISAPSVSFSIVFFMIIFGSGFSMAGTTLISQAKGKGDEERINFYVSQVFLMLSILSVIIMAAGILGADYLLIAMQVPRDILPTVATYLRIIFIGMPLMFMSFVLRATLQGVGDSVTPMKIQIITVIVNVILDPILIFGLGPVPALGVAGAAIATIIARGVSMVMVLRILITGKRGIKLERKYLKPDPTAWRLIIKIGLPSSVGGGISALGFTVMQGLVNTYGAAVIAAFGVGNRIIGLFNMPAQGISQATAVLVGQCLGRKDHKAAEQTVSYGILTILLFVVSGMVVTFFYGNSVTRFFIDDPEVISYGAQLFRVVSLSVVFFCLFTVINGAFQGGGDTKPIMVFNILRLWGLRIPLALLLTQVFEMGPVGIWWAMCISNILVAAGNYMLYRTGRWKYRLNPEQI